jgi:PKD repeat protein
MVIDKRLTLVALAVVATAACTVKDTQTPALSGPSGLALTLRVSAIPDTISQDGGSQSSIRVTAIGPDGRPAIAVPLRVDISVQGTPQDYGTLSARTIVTGNDGTAAVVFTAPPAPTNGVFLNNCIGLPGTCISIVAAATGSNLVNTNPESAVIRLVPTGVILPPATTPVPCITASPSAVAANVPVQFTAGTVVGSGSNASCGPATSDIVSFSWNFGDGSSGAGRSITHTFTSANAFNVTLTETNDRGISGSTSQSITVGSAALPTPTFTFSPQAPAVNEPVFFNASASSAGAGHTISSYRWTFGDGATGSGQTVSHAYAAPGDYIVQLTITDEAGQSSTSAGTTVTAGGQSTPAPTANFTFSPNPPAVGDTVVFDWRTSTAAQGARIVSLDWNFGDSTPIVHCPGDAACTADGITTHVFRSTGTFAVNLVVTDSSGRTSVASKTVAVVSGNPVPTCTASPATVATNTLVLLSARNTQVFGSATIQSYNWNFGDPASGAQNTSTLGPDTSHSFVTAGTKTVIINVVDSIGRQGSGSCQVTVQ